ncbi:MAG: fibronectin type III domain-containing protein, partial [Planctomycetota bacterium]
TSQGITATGLTSGTTYRFRVKARNLFATETNWYPLDDPDPAYVEQATGSPTCQYFAGDLNGDSEIDGADIRCMLECVLDGAAVGCDCACGDMYPPPDGGDGLDMNDVAAFVDAMLG